MSGKHAGNPEPEAKEHPYETWAARTSNPQTDPYVGTQEVEAMANPQDRPREVVYIQEKKQPETWIAYLLCLFIGQLGIHRFYLGRNKSAKTMLILSLCIIGLPVTVVWAIVDLFLIPGIIREETGQ